MDKELIRHLMQAMERIVDALEKLDAAPVEDWQGSPLPSIGYDVREARAELDEAQGRLAPEALLRALETLKRFPR